MENEWEVRGLVTREGGGRTGTEEGEMTLWKRQERQVEKDTRARKREGKGRCLNYSQYIIMLATNEECVFPFSD